MLSFTFLSAFLASTALALPKPQLVVDPSDPTDGSTDISFTFSFASAGETATPVGGSGGFTATAAASTFVVTSGGVATTYPATFSVGTGVTYVSFPTGAPTNVAAPSFPVVTTTPYASYGYYPTASYGAYPTASGTGSSLPSNSSLLSCGDAYYSPSLYTCYDGSFLCPVIAGTPTLRCGGACYLPSLYSCSANNTLITISNSTTILPTGGVSNTTVDFASEKRLKARVYPRLW